MAYEMDDEMTYEELPLIARIFEAIRELTTQAGLWVILVGGTGVTTIGIVQLLLR